MKCALYCALFLTLFGFLTCNLSPWTAPPGTAYSTYPFPYVYEPQCPLITTDVSQDFQNAIYATVTSLYKRAAFLSDSHFIFSPFTIWMALAAIAEGADETTKNGLLYFLNLPQDKCIRELYYKIATIPEVSNQEVFLKRNKQLIIDSNVILNPNWERRIKSYNLIDIFTAPFKTYPNQEIDIFRNLFNAQLPYLNLNGNSVIMESLDYSGLWTTAFSDAVIEHGPFFSVYGEKIGTVEYMKTRMPVKMAYLPRINMKVVQIPLGSDQKYTLLIGVTLGPTVIGRTVNDIQASIIFESLSNLRESLIPIEVVIPRMIMTSEFDVRKLLEDFNIKSIWSDPYATRNISSPSLLPSSYIQRVTATIDSHGLQPSIQRYNNFVPPLPQHSIPYNTTGLDPILGTDFIANRPFLFGMINTDNYLGSFAGVFSKPSSFKF